MQSSNHTRDKHFTVYPRFFSRAVWSCQQLVEMLARLAVKDLFPSSQTIYTVGDDTLYPKSGKKISGSGLFRDAILSTHETVTRWGLNFVTTGLIIKNEKDSSYQCLPLLSQLHQKGENTPSQIMVNLLSTFAKWFPDKEIRHTVDGYYSNKEVIGGLPENVQLTGRIRCDAVLYDIPEVGKRKRGRPRKKGEKLPIPREWPGWSKIEWQKIKFNAYGKEKDVLVKQKIALWYRVAKGRLLNIIVARDPAGKWSDEYFFSTDLKASPTMILEDVVRRNAIEAMHKDSKQIMGVHQGQSRTKQAVERQIPFGLWLMGFVMIWYLKYGQGSKYDRIPYLPWYRQKRRVCFIDMLACLRQTLLTERFLINSTLHPQVQKIIYPLISALART